MPFRSEAQRRYLYANEPEVAKRWAKETPAGRLPERVGKQKKGKRKSSLMDALERGKSRMGR